MQRIVRRLQRHRELVLFFISALLLPIFLDLISEWLQTVLGETPAQLLQIAGIIAALLAGLLILYKALGTTEALQLVPEEERPPRFPGLILLVGRGNEEVYATAIEYHLRGQEGEGEGLRVCWLIATDGLDGSISIAEQLRQKYKTACHVIVCKLNSAFDVKEAYRVVHRIYTHEVEKYGLKPEQVISDFTGGTKPMAAGMVLACQKKWPMQYMVGKPGEIATTPMYVRFTQEGESW